jgi:hypothetical protein
MSYHCATCGQEHEGLPDIGFDAPDPYLDVPVAEREARTAFTPDHCRVRDDDGEHYFVRGVIPIPIHGQDEPFGLGTWVSQSRDDYERYVAKEAQEPTLGWLSNHIAHYAISTYALKARLHFREHGLRPMIELEPTEHPLAVEQREGISLERAWEIVHLYMPS